MASNVLVFIEQRGGKVHPASLQLFTPAAALASAAGGQVEAGVVGSEIGEIATTAARHGARKVYAAKHADLNLYNALSYTAAMTEVVKAASPRTVLFPATFMGRDLAPRLAARLGAASATDCVEVRPEGTALRVKRTLYSGKTLAEFELAADRVQVVSVRANAYVAPPPDESAKCDVQEVSGSFADRRCKTVEIVGTTAGVKDVTEADIVVSGGRSLKSEDNFKILYKLAELLDAAVGASRAACDAGYQPHTRQVGLTGKVITPKLYIACGIDGAIQHLAGMRGSKVIVAVNTKKEAPIYNVATYGCVCDLFVLVPLITEEVRKLRA